MTREDLEDLMIAYQNSIIKIRADALPLVHHLRNHNYPDAAYVRDKVFAIETALDQLDKRINRMKHVSGQ